MPFGRDHIIQRYLPDRNLVALGKARDATEFIKRGRS